MRAFFIVGPTATGKSELAATVARKCDAEIVSADAFQIYRGLNLLTAKPDLDLQASVPHHLVGTVPITEELNAQKFRALALTAIEEINARKKLAIVVGGSGLYIKAITHGLAPLPGADLKLRERLNQLTARELYLRLITLDPESARHIDKENPRRLIRAIEICLLTGKPVSAQRARSIANTNAPAHGVFVFFEKADLYDRIDRRVETMFAEGVVEEVRALKSIGPTAEQTLGLREIRQLIAGEISEQDCIARIQQATRRYAKRQLTWFRRQTSFSPLNLSHYDRAEAIEWILREARLSSTHRDV